MYSVTMDKFVKEFELENLTPKLDLSDRILSKSEVNRPALQMAGFFEHFDSDRIQIMGNVEYSYLSQREEGLRKAALRKIFESKIPCFVICKNLEPFPEILEYAMEYQVPVFRCPNNTSDFMGEVIRWLKTELADRITMHGVLVDVYGEGLLIIGDSGIGKSETALELVKRGHRLVADDAVEIKRISHNILVGTSPELIRYFIELRGIGIINVRELFGVSSVKLNKNIDLVIKLEMWDEEKEYDRLGISEDYIDIMGNKVLCNSIPIRPGRNVAVICESAAINNRQKKLGYNAALDLNNKINHNLEKKSF